MRIAGRVEVVVIMVVVKVEVAVALIVLPAAVVLAATVLAAVVLAGKATDVFGRADARLVVGTEVLLLDVTSAVVGAAVVFLVTLSDGGTNGHATPSALQHHFFCSAVHVVSAFSKLLQSKQPTFSLRQHQFFFGADHSCTQLSCCSPHLKQAMSSSEQQ